MACPDGNLILEFLGGKLPAGEVSRIDEHVAACAACRTLLAALARQSVVEGGLSSGAVADPAAEARADEGLLVAGATVGGFVILRRIGQGGMGEVYLARDTALGRKVAIKVISPSQLGSPAARDRLLREARITASLNHPHIMTVHAVGELEGMPYLVLEYVEGHTLRQRMDEGRLGLRECLRIGLAIAEALAEAHAGGVLHRDLKPSNVLLARDGRLRVVDFGLASRLEGPRPESSGELAGSPRYMAPEQWAATGCTAGTDLWALGLILWELVQGSHPYEAIAPVTLSEVVRGAEPMPQLQADDRTPRPLADLINSCLDKQASGRPGARQAGEALRRLLAADQAPAGSEDNPFRGLLPFAEQHAGLFFGRQVEVAALLERLRDEPMLLVAGPSGVGKSSFVMAGVVPRLREQGGWLVLQLRPGSRPFSVLAERLVLGESSASNPLLRDEARRLADELAHSPERLALELYRMADQHRARVVLVIDQLEELFTLADDAATARQFVCGLLSVADDPRSPVRVLATIRDDYLFRVAESLERSSVGGVSFLRAPGQAALREILCKPVEAAGYRFEDPALVDEIVASVSGETACLPLLQFCGEALWEGRSAPERVLRRSVYQAIGGVTGALVQRADGVIDELGAADAVLARDLLLRLITPAGTRRVVARPRLLEGLGPRAGAVLDALARARLLSLRKPRGGEAQDAEVELAHESLIGSWKQLARWADENREARLLLGELEQAAELWERRGSRPDELWEGHALDEARRALERGEGRVPETVRRFIEAGLHKRRRRFQRRQRARALLTGGLLLLALLSLLAALSYRRQSRRAEEEWQKAQQKLAEALRRSAELAMLRGDPRTAGIKLRGSLEIEDSIQGRALWRKLRQQPVLWSRNLGAVAHTLAFSPDGRTLALGSADRALRLLDAGTGEGEVLRQGTDQILAVAFSADARWLAWASWSGSIHLLSRSGATRILRGHRGAVWGLRFVPGGDRLASAGADGMVRLWDAERGSLAQQLETGAAVRSLQISRDGRWLATGAGDGTVQLWRIGSDGVSLAARWAASRREIRSVDFRPDGKELAAGGADMTVRLFAVPGGHLVRTLVGHAQTVTQVAFSPDGSTLATGGADMSIRLWQAATGEPRGSITQPSTILGLAFEPRGGKLAWSGYDGTVQILDLTHARPVPPHLGPVLDVRFSPDGRRLASSGADRSVRLWEVATGRCERVLGSHGDSVAAVRFSPDGKKIASASYDGVARVFETDTGRELLSLRGHHDKVRGVTFNARGDWLASFGDEGGVRVWDLTAGSQRALLGGRAGLCAEFARSGDRLAVGSSDGAIRIWDVRGGRLERTLAAHDSSVAGLVFDDDGTLLSSSFDGTVRRSDPRSGAVRVLARFPGRLYGLALDPARRLMVVASASGEARLVAGAEVRGSLLGHRGEVNAVSLSPDGGLVASAGSDGTVRLWDATTGSPVRRAVGPAGPAGEGRAALEAALRLVRGGQTPSAAALIRRDAQPVLVGAGFLDGRVMLWDVVSGALLEEVRLHGAVTRLVERRSSLTATTELGDSTELDLGPLRLPYPVLLEQLHRDAPLGQLDRAGQLW